MHCFVLISIIIQLLIFLCFELQTCFLIRLLVPVDQSLAAIFSSLHKTQVGHDEQPRLMERGEAMKVDPGNAVPVLPGSSSANLNNLITFFVF